MGLYTATTQNVILIGDQNVIGQIAESKDGKVLAEKLGIHINTIALNDNEQDGLAIHATEPGYDHIYAGEVFEFVIPQSIENEVLESKAIEFLESFPEFVALEGNYDLTRAAMRTSVIS